MSLHDDIMNIPATPSTVNGINYKLSYKEGHRDARHAAAELALKADAEIDRLRGALQELHERITGHPMYQELTEAEEEDVGGDTAELSYLARIADDALTPTAHLLETEL